MEEFVLVLLTVVGAILKIFGVISLNWAVILIPIVVGLPTVFVVYFIYGYFEAWYKDIKKEK